MATVTKNTSVENDLIAAVALLSEASLADNSTADCDADGMIEPVAFKTAPVAAPKPVGGGLLPDAVGANKTDPWKSAYGYCVWDHGTATKVAGCGGAGANRLSGGDIATATAIVVISAGPDRIFQTSCSNYVAAGTPVVTKTSGSDDVVREVAYGAFLLPRMTDAKIGEKPDAACTAQTTGTMRMELGVVQVCMDTGWEEVGTSAQADSEFIPVTNAALGSLHTSNQISFSGFMNTKTITVTGAATLLINGSVTASPATIQAGDAISLRANASATPEVTNTFSISVSGVRKTWTIRTRDYYPASLTITPAGKSGMNVTVPGTPGYGAVVGFLVRNTGEEATAALGVNLSNLTNFAYYPNQATGDACRTKILAPNAVCTIDIRPYANGETSYVGTLTVTGGSSPVGVTVSGTSSGWSCTAPWGATVNHNASVPAYQTSSVAYNATCASETRSCNLGVLSGSYTHQTCAPATPLSCTRPWGGTLAHGGSITAYAAASVPYGGTCQSQTRTCTNGSLSGSYTNQNCAPAAPSSCSAPWGGTVAHSASITAYAAASVPFGGTCQSQTRTCTNGSLSGSYTASGCSAAAPTYSYGGWSGYGGCSATCGGGSQTRTRLCLRQDGVSSSCSLCGGVCSESVSCNTHSCCVTEGPHFSQWDYVWNNNSASGGSAVAGGYWGGASVGWGPVGISSIQSGGWTYYRGSLQWGNYYSIGRTTCW